MAKKRRKKAGTSKKRRATKKKRRKSGGLGQRMKVGGERARLHKAASLLHDFHGGKLPIKSGCGRPRKKRRS